MFDVSILDKKKPDANDFNGTFGQIVPFDHYETPDIPADILPSPLKEYVESICDVLCVPTAMPVMAALGIVSAAVNKKFVISPNKPDWRESINIYTMIAMPPASNKSQCLKFLKFSMDEWEKKKARDIEPKRNEALMNIKMKEQELNKYYSILRSVKSQINEINAAKENIAKLEPLIKKMYLEVPVIPQIYTTDATPESLAEMLMEQGERMAVISDEGGITEVLSGLYSNGAANVDVVLKGIDGGTTRIKRKEKDIQMNPFLSIVLLVQPQILMNMADKRSFTGNGMLERYLYALPIGNVGYREFTDTVLDEFYKFSYGNIIYNLLCIDMPDEPYCLKLDTPSLVMFQDFQRQEIERELRANGKLYICRGWAGKLAGYTLRLAGLMHVAENQNVEHLIIQKETMQRAIALARLLMEHAVSAFNLMGADEAINDGKEVFDWLEAKKLECFNKTDISFAMRNRKLGKKKRLNAALAMLAERNIISEVHCDYSTAKPTDIYFVNPKIF